MRLEKQRGHVLQGFEVCGQKFEFYSKCFEDLKQGSNMMR